MRRPFPILVLALLLAHPAFAQDVPAEKQDVPAETQDVPAEAQDVPAEVQDAEPSADAVAPSDDPDAVESAATKVPLEEIRRYVGVYNAVKEAYVDPVDDKKLMGSAIRGLLLDLDPHSAYLQKDDAEAFDEDTNGATPMPS